MARLISTVASARCGTVGNNVEPFQRFARNHRAEAAVLMRSQTKVSVLVSVCNFRFLQLKFGWSRFATTSFLLRWSGNAATDFWVCRELSLPTSLWP